MITDVFHRRRLLFWLIRAYIKKRKRTIGLFFLAGIVVSLFLFLAKPLLLPFVPRKTQSIGVIGSYTIETLPQDLQNKISLGLTRLSEKGEASSSAALFFTATSAGKTYTFTLRDDLFWQDGKKFVAKDVNYNFKDVQTQVKSDKEIAFALKEPFAPFPTVLAQPLFRKGLVGLSGGGSLRGYGEYKVINIDLSGLQVRSLTIEGDAKETQNERIIYKFYANEEEAKVHFMLGEVSMLQNIIAPKDLQYWKNVKVSKSVEKNQLVTLFYNTSVPLLADKGVRQALTFALPSDFNEEEKAYSPLNPNSWAYVPQTKFSQNFDTAKKLLSNSKEATRSSELKVTLTTTMQFEELAKRIKEAWRQIGVEMKIEVVSVKPSDPQMWLERFIIPPDPDEYALWHSTQTSNISRYANPKIDKLLEDGRQTTNPDERAQIYADFQKYLVDETPAAFLYYPTMYTISRK